MRRLASVLLCLPALMFSNSLAEEGDGWPTTRWRFVCEDEGGAEACQQAAEVSALLFEEASEFLSGLGFRKPRVAHEEIAGIVTHFLAHMSDAVVEETGFVAVYMPTSEAIWLRTDRFFAMGEPGDDPDGASMQTRQTSIFAPVHELFHAVQKNYQPSISAGDGRLWIWEGTANAIMMSFAESQLATQWRPANYDIPLNERVQIDAYGTWMFWYTLGELLSSPGKVAYLDGLLRSDLSKHFGLAALDDLLADQGRLYVMLPRVFARFDTRKWFGEPLRGETVLPAGQSEVEVPIWGRVRQVAGHAAAWTVREESDRAVVLDLRFEEDHPDLHLIVDGQTYDSNLADRNVYSVILDGAAELEIVVANVAPMAVDSAEREFTMLLTLRELAPCAPGDMMSAVDPVSGVMSAEAYMNSYAPGGNISQFNLLMPVAGRLQISGAVQGGGTACTEPIGTNPMIAAASTEGAINAAQRQAGAITAAGRSQVGDESDALIQVYSPNAISWQSGTLSDPLMFDHGGADGWPANSAANLVIRITGVAPKDLEAGKRYSAQSVEANPFGISAGDNEANPYNTIFTTWQGRKQRVGMPPELAALIPAEAMQEAMNSGFGVALDNAFVFEGESVWVYLLPDTPLTGTVTVDSIRAGVVTGSFELSGTIGKQTLTKEIRYDQRTNQPDGDRIVDRNTETGGITVSGQFAAPAVEAVYRGMRPVSNTASLIPEQEKQQ